MKSTRAYTMRARAQSAEETRLRILASATRLLHRRLRSDIRLDDVAADAGVTVPTVLRVFGSKDALFRLAFDEIIGEMSAQLGHTEPGDVVGAVRTWFDHYEVFGDAVINSLSDEGDPAVGPIVAIGRTKHRERVERAFAPQLERVAPADRARTVDALMCAGDVYTWKLLRRDAKRSRRDAEDVMRTMIDGILAVV